MAGQFYVTIEGAKQGVFKADVVVGGAPKLVGLSWSVQVTSPRDAATGQASGKRQYMPIVFTKEWGASSPQLFAALSTNEELNTVLFEFVRADAHGNESTYATITLTTATVSAIKQYTDSGPTYRQLEDISLTFERIDMRDVAGGTNFSDTWLPGIW